MQNMVSAPCGILVGFDIIKLITVISAKVAMIICVCLSANSRLVLGPKLVLVRYLIPTIFIDT